MTKRADNFRRESMSYLIMKGIPLQKERTEMEKMERTEKTEKADKRTQDKRGRTTSVHPAGEKCRAVLSVWTEKRRATEVCRELGIAGPLLNQWQNRAMEGMLLALGPRVPVEKAVALSPRLAVLLDKKVRQGSMKGLERRLACLQSKTRLNARSPSKSGDSQEIGA
jgi:transposase-like protein